MVTALAGALDTAVLEALLAAFVLVVAVLVALLVIFVEVLGRVGCLDMADVILLRRA
jgi:hypothetical protein